MKNADVIMKNKFNVRTEAKMIICFTKNVL